ncbi:MAG: serine/threonine-protein kinase, partial [Pseudomonadota bacterium]
MTAPYRASQLPVSCPRCKTQHKSPRYDETSQMMRCLQCGMLFRSPEKTESTEWKTGQVLLDLYEVNKVLGTGSFGTVYHLYHRGWNSHLAVKSPKANTLQAAGGMDNFEREATTWVNLGLHPHIVNCYYVRRIDSIPRVFMEYVDGGSLDQWIKQRTLYQGEDDTAILARMLDVAIQFAWGLHYAHEARIVHQDVKPANVMMTKGGIAKVTDFGLAWARPLKDSQSQSNDTNNTDTFFYNGIGMTLGYASPEQQARKPLTRRTDVWSWAVSILEMFAGERVWSTGS